MTAADIAALVRERMTEIIPSPSPRLEIIRDLPQPARFNLVHIITGMRRCGKTFYLFQLMQSLLAQGVERTSMLYFDFSDERLKPLDRGIMQSVVDEYWRQVPDARENGCYLFLDEVQEVDEWQGFCQRIAEQETVTLVITGSSSKVSSSEIASSFRGRSHVHEMWPLSFAEYCSFNGIPLPPSGQTAFSPQETTRYEAAFDEYLQWGGFPGIQQRPNGDRIELLQGYVRDVVARDVTERAGREDIALTMQLALFALRNTACELSSNDLAKRLTGLGYKAYWNKVNQLLELLQQAYLIHYLPEYTTMLKPNTTAIPKVYAEDHGLAYAVSRANQQDHGKRLETLVYLELRRRFSGRRTDSISSLSVTDGSDAKVDFLTGDALGLETYELIQVCYDMSAGRTRKREIGSLEAGMRFTRLREGIILTLREEGSVQSETGSIRIMPTWKWCLLPHEPGAEA